MKEVFKWIGIIAGIVAIIWGAALLEGLIVMKLWNWLLPDLFGWKVITFWQSWGICVLLEVLFGFVKCFSSK